MKRLDFFLQIHILMRWALVMFLWVLWARKTLPHSVPPLAHPRSRSSVVVVVQPTNLCNAERASGTTKPYSAKLTDTKASEAYKEAERKGTRPGVSYDAPRFLKVKGNEKLKSFRVSVFCILTSDNEGSIVAIPVPFSSWLDRNIRRGRSFNPNPTQPFVEATWVWPWRRDEPRNKMDISASIVTKFTRASWLQERRNEFLNDK